MSRSESLCLTRPRSHACFRLVVSVFVLLALVAIRPSLTDLQQIRQRGTLNIVALAVDGPESAKTLPQTFGGEITRLWANELGVSAHVIWASDVNQAVRMLKRHEADLAMTGLTVGDPALRSLRVSQSYMDVNLQLVGHSTPLASLAPLAHTRIAVFAHTSEAELGRQLVEMMPSISLMVKPSGGSFDDLLASIDHGDADFALVDSATFAAHRALHPHLQIAMNLSHGAHLAWAFAPGSDTSIYAHAQNFLSKRRADGTLQRLADFYRPDTHFDEQGAVDFEHDIAHRLPSYAPIFQHYASADHLDWHILAAIAYQESHWEPAAISPTGVQGMMMLTASTAQDLGVDNRQNVHQSVRAGCDYFKIIMDSLPPEVAEPDRTWMALAAYNMGPGHLDDARWLTQKMGKNPDLWADVRDALPLLADPHWYRKLPHGYTRNSRQVLAYVSQVRRYYDALLLSHADSMTTRMAMR